MSDQEKKVNPLKNLITSIRCSAVIDEVKFNGSMISTKNGFVKLEDLARRYYLEYVSQHCKIHKNDVFDVLAQIKYEQHSLSIEKLKQSIKFTEANDLIHKWVKSVIGEAANLDLYTAVVAHFVWQVKRKIFNLQVDNHLMPVITGKQGSGKSTAISKLVSPIKTYSVSLDVSAAGDQREYFYFHSNYVCFFDELAKAHRTDIESLKKLITSPKLTYRILGRNENTEAYNVCTFIGATNGKVDDMIYDPTGMRRFIEIPGLDQLNWEVINLINYESLWKSVDENASSPIVPYLPKVKELQENIRALDTAEEWIAENEIQFSEELPVNKRYFNPSPADLYSLYRLWMLGQSRNKIFSKMKFARRVHELGAIQQKSGKRFYYITAKDDFRLPEGLLDCKEFFSRP